MLILSTPPPSTLSFSTSCLLWEVTRTPCKEKSQNGTNLRGATGQSWLGLQADNLSKSPAVSHPRLETFPAMRVGTAIALVLFALAASAAAEARRGGRRGNRGRISGTEKLGRNEVRKDSNNREGRKCRLLIRL